MLGKIFNMTQRITLFTFFIICFFRGYTQKLSHEYQKVVQDFIQFVKTDNNFKIANLVTYPFEREYPIPEIKNKDEFVKRYSEIFEDSLKQIIIKSDPVNDWKEMGWRGLMLNQGDIWLDLDGRLISINYQSKFEKSLRNKLIEEEKEKLYTSLKNYKKPIYILETSKYRIRIDYLGGLNYRYACWPIEREMSEKPDLVIENGEFIPDGSGGNHSFKFKNGEYIYECYITVIGENDSPPALLTIYKNEKEILEQKAKIRH